MSALPLGAQCIPKSRFIFLLQDKYGPDYTKPENTAAKVGRVVDICGHTRPQSLVY